ncbi:MAG: TetR/AcrR family transcriptional regulator [Paludibacteraceae bacterium]|nr:TetR/AcrR family transcriptional regulator [Paludibacteraceae bacterium]
MSEEVQKNIIKKAGELFFRLGIRSVSIDDICRELGISKKTFYVYFESKDELIEHLLQANLRHMASKMEHLLFNKGLRSVVADFTRRNQEKDDVRRVPQLVYDLKKYYPRQFADFQHQSFEQQKRYIYSFLEKGIAEGLVRADLNIELTSVLFAKIYADALRDFEEMEAAGYNVTQLGHVALDVMIRGVLSEEGMRLYKN